MNSQIPAIVPHPLHPDPLSIPGLTADCRPLNAYKLRSTKLVI